MSISIKGKDQSLMKAAASTDLLVCFPSRATLRCSQLHPSPHLKRMSARAGGQSSPLLRGPQTKRRDLEIAEPTSPKVTCAGQIKAQTNSNRGCKSSESLMEEIEKIHKKKGKKQRRRHGSNWLESLGLKKEVMQLLSCLRCLTIDLRLRCLSKKFPTSDDEEDEEEGEGAGADLNSDTLFSKWFMVLQEENQNYDFCRKHRASVDPIAPPPPPPPPPPNALLLMRCRSAPVRRWLTKEEDVEKRRENKDGGESRTRKLRWLMDEENMKELEEDKHKKKKKPLSVEMRETWLIARKSKSWKR